MTENIEHSDKIPVQAPRLQTTCKHCQSLMPSGAVICPVCKLYTTWWRNQFRIDHIGLFLTCIIIFLSYCQFRAVSDERTKSSEALQRAQTVEQSVKAVKSQVEGLRSDITKAQKQVEDLRAFRQAGEHGAEEIARALEQVRSLQDQLELTKKRMEEIDKRVSDIPSKPTRPSLKYLESKFTKTEAGLRGDILFEATNDLQLSHVEFKVILLPGNEGMIKSISPAMPLSMMVSTRIAPDGRQATLSYTVVGSGKPGIRIVLSEPSMLRIEAIPGIEAFDVKAK